MPGEPRPDHHVERFVAGERHERVREALKQSEFDARVLLPESLHGPRQHQGSREWPEPDRHLAAMSSRQLGQFLLRLVEL